MGLDCRRWGLEGMQYAFNFRDIWAQQPFLIRGIGVTLSLSLVTMMAGLAIGGLGAAMRVCGGTIARAISSTYVEIIRNTPLLVQLFITFFGLPSAGIRLDAMSASFIALSV